jgi:hypothetical protein
VSLSLKEKQLTVFVANDKIPAFNETKIHNFGKHVAA